MKISDNYKKIIVDEFRSVAGKMKEMEDLSKKLYWFSAAYGVVFRVFNLEFDATLVFVHMILNAAYSTISGRLAAIREGKDETIDIPEGLFDSLQEVVEELAENIEMENEHDIFKNLQRIANLTYATTGNGYYLYQKGVLQL